MYSKIMVISSCPLACFTKAPTYSQSTLFTIFWTNHALREEQATMAKAVTFIKQG
jgi:hypothetical protein